MGAVDDFITNLRQCRDSDRNTQMIGNVDLFIAALTALNGGTGSTNFAPVSNTRLTLTAGVPILNADVTGANAHICTPYLGNKCPIFDGTQFSLQSFAETSQLLADATKSPAASVANSTYNIFGWMDGATFRATRGAVNGGVAELTTILGVRLNGNAIANGPAVQRGTFLGTIGTSAANLLDMMFNPVAALGGTQNRLLVWNMYNRRDVCALNIDSTTTWTQATTATWRAKNNNANNGTTFVCGLQEDCFTAINMAGGECSTANGFDTSWGLDSTTVRHAKATVMCVGAQAINKLGVAEATLIVQPTPGLHTITPLELNEVNTSTTTWAGVTTGFSGNDIHNLTQFIFPM